MQFSNSLTAWYLQNKRDLPWRNTTNPYKIWLSEIILQQTRVAQGLPYFLKFVKHFPTIFDLANASEEEVLKLWQGLGYYSRARNLHTTAKIIANDFSGEFPTRFKELLKLKGIGDYTAAAIASFSFNEAIPVVDGNVFRVLARYFDIETNIALPSAKKEFFELALELISKEDPALFNQAIMEFGALQCVPKNPDCLNCILNSSCLALQKKKVNELPVKLKTLKITHRYLNYIVAEDEDQKIAISKRDKKGIWHNLYEFPLLETETNVEIDYVFEKVKETLFQEDQIISFSEINDASVIHKLSHQTLHIKFWKILIKNKNPNSIGLEELVKLPFPIVLYNFIENHW